MRRAEHDAAPVRRGGCAVGKGWVFAEFSSSTVSLPLFASNQHCQARRDRERRELCSVEVNNKAGAGASGHCGTRSLRKSRWLWYRRLSHPFLRSCCHSGDAAQVGVVATIFHSERVRCGGDGLDASVPAPSRHESAFFVNAPLHLSSALPPARCTAPSPLPCRRRVAHPRTHTLTWSSTPVATGVRCPRHYLVEAVSTLRIIRFSPLLAVQCTRRRKQEAHTQAHTHTLTQTQGKWGLRVPCCSAHGRATGRRPRPRQDFFAELCRLSPACALRSAVAA